MSSERRLIRPYLGVDRVQSSLNRVKLHVDEKEVQPGGKLFLGLGAFFGSRVMLVFGHDEDDARNLARELEDGVTKAALDVDDVEVMAVVVAERLKRSEVFSIGTIADLPEKYQFVLADGQKWRCAAMNAPYGGFSIHLYVVLAKDLRHQPLRPSRRGTWLARNTYFVAATSGPIGFTPIPMTDDERRRLGVPPATLRYVDFDDPILPSDSEELSICFYVDSELLENLTKASTRATSLSFQRELFLDAMSAIVMESSRRLCQDDSLRFEDCEGSLVGRVVEWVVGSGASTEEKESAMTLIRENPRLFVAHLESSIENMKKGMLSMMSDVG